MSPKTEEEFVDVQKVVGPNSLEARGISITNFPKCHGVGL